jgi:hypothetical protein
MEPAKADAWILVAIWGNGNLSGFSNSCPVGASERAEQEGYRSDSLQIPSPGSGSQTWPWDTEGERWGICWHSGNVYELGPEQSSRYWEKALEKLVEGD